MEFVAKHYKKELALYTRESVAVHPLPFEQPARSLRIPTCHAPQKQPAFLHQIKANVFRLLYFNGTPNGSRRFVDTLRFTGPAAFMPGARDAPHPPRTRRGVSSRKTEMSDLVMHLPKRTGLFLSKR